MKQLLTITALLFSLNIFGQSFDDTLLRFDWGVPKYVVKWQLVKAVPTACTHVATTDKFGRTSNSYVSCALLHYELKREKLSKEFKSVYLALQFYKELVEESKKGHPLFHNGIDSIETVPKYISTLSDTIVKFTTQKRICGLAALDSISNKYKQKAEKAAKEADKHFKLNYKQ